MFWIFVNTVYWATAYQKYHIAQKTKLSIKDSFSICDQIPRKLRIWLHLLNKFLMENFIFCAVSIAKTTLGYKFVDMFESKQPRVSTCVL